MITLIFTCNILDFLYANDAFFPQINFFKDHTKIVIAGERSDVSIMFISSDRQSFTYRLSQLAEVGCDAMVRERLVYALSCLRQYAELDGEEV